MGWGYRIFRSYARQLKPPKNRMPQRAVATVGTTVHRLSWADKHAGYRMRCSCGWVDSALRSNERQAINTGNAHVVRVRRAASEQQRQPRKRVTAAEGLVVITLMVVATVIALVVANLNRPHTSYDDGYQWGGANTVGIISKTAPSCLQSEMVSSGPVDDPNFIIHKPQGANEPNDNFDQWYAGCEAGAKNVLAGN